MRIKSAVKMCIVGMLLLLMVQGVQAQTDWFDEGNKMFVDGYYDQAIENYEKAVEIDPGNDVAWSNMGVSYIMVEQYSDAIPCFDKALEINPNDTDHWWGKGFALDMLGRYDDAITCYDKALEISPNDADLWYYKAVTLEQLGRQDEAVTCYNKAASLDPSYASDTESVSDNRQSTPLVSAYAGLGILLAGLAFIMVGKRNRK